MLIENIITGSLEYLDLDYEQYSWSLGPCSLDLYQPCNGDRIKFYLFTRDTRHNPVLLSASDTGPPPQFNWKTNTKVLIHGYAGNVDFNGTVLVRKAYLKNSNYNVIVVDWGRLVQLPCYPTAVLNTWQAGKCTAQLLANLTRLQLHGYDFKKIHVIGFSLGAHVAAYASNALRKQTGRPLGRITGLDPALPFFASLKPSWKLDKADADFVDVIHTNSGIFGKIEPTGHVDFYVNGGFRQPACVNVSNVPLCSHLMATVYYAESISNNTNGFWGTPCPGFFQYVTGWCLGASRRVLMGENAMPRSRGVYFVETADRPPFARG